MAEMVEPELPDGPTAFRLKNQSDWYDKKSSAAQRAFKRIKVTEIVAAALIPLLGSLTLLFPFIKENITWISGGLGVLITILEGILHLNRYQENWNNYRSTAEALKHEKFLYLAQAGPYAKTPTSDPDALLALLAERVESLVSQEHAKWINIQTDQEKKKP
jgi:hypothetical protein